MKPSKLIYVMILLTLLACVPKIRIESIQSHDVSDESLFSKAEN
ncbi:MAG: Penicillin-binding protein activator, partial [Thermodesulfobacteriota bacterium]|nr:Penicillin-binding protein activator [Thermodesulfobacteriota bacterium]